MFLVYTQVENHVLNPIVMSRTVRVNPLLVLLSILVGASIGSWIGGIFGAFVAALLAIPAAGAIQVVIRELWQATAPAGCPAGPGRAAWPSGRAGLAGRHRRGRAGRVAWYRTSGTGPPMSSHWRAPSGRKPRPRRTGGPGGCPPAPTG